MGHMTTALIPEVITTGQLAQRWGTTQEALRCRRYRGTGPEFISLGNTVLYLASTIEAWEQAYGPMGRRPRRDSKRYAETLEASA